MKVILDICGVAYLAKDAATAAKVADLLGAMQPVTREYLSEPGAVWVDGHDPRYRAAVSATQWGTAKLWTRKDFEAEKAKQQAEAEAEEHRIGEENARIPGGAQ